MLKKMIQVNKTMKKGFDQAYYAKVHCPACKEHIFARALICPFCKTNLKDPMEQRHTSWQKGVLIFFLVISIFTCGSIISHKGPIVLGLFAGCVIYGIGYILVQKIQSFNNYHRQ